MSYVYISRVIRAVQVWGLDAYAIMIAFAYFLKPS